jgi:predicted nucleotidyltransferase
MDRLQAVLRDRSEILVGILHGSFHAGGPFRDVDVALYIHPDRIENTTWREYETDLGVQLSADIGLPVDIRVLNDAPVAFRYHACTEGNGLAGSGGVFSGRLARENLG